MSSSSVRNESPRPEAPAPFFPPPREVRYLNGGNTELARYFGYTGIGELRQVRRDSTESSYQCYYDAQGEYVCDWVPEVYGTKNLGVFYDAASNLQQQVDSVANVTTTATIDPGNRLRQWDGMAYGYDRDGNLVSRVAGSDTTRFGWDATGQLRWAAFRSDTTYYDYDAGGQLVRRRKPGNVTERWYLWDGGQLVAELNAQASGRIAEYAYYRGVDEPLALITGPSGSSVVHWYQQSGHGNVDGLLGATGSVEQTLRYDEWGRLEAFSSGIADSTRLRWKGLYYDGGPADLYYMRARWYDPKARRFVSEDPIRLAGGINLYAFGGNDPINISDPSGLDPNVAYLIPGVTIYASYCTGKRNEDITSIGCTSGQYRDQIMNAYRRWEESRVRAGQVAIGYSGGGGAVLESVSFAPARTRDQCFSENTAPVRDAVRGAGAQLAATAATWWVGLKILSRQAHNQGAATGVPRGYSRWEGDVRMSVRGGSARTLTGRLLTGSATFGALTFVGLGAYASTSAAICSVNPNYGN